MIVSSTFEEGAQHPDGRRSVTEYHVDEDGDTLRFDWLGTEPAQDVMEARAAMLNKMFADRAAVAARIAGTKLPWSKLELRGRFTRAELELIDEFNDLYLTYDWLTADQKRSIRTFLKDYESSRYVNYTDPRWVAGLAMYVQAGILAPNRPAEILNG